MKHKNIPVPIQPHIWINLFYCFTLHTCKNWYLYSKQIHEWSLGRWSEVSRIRLKKHFIPTANATYHTNKELLHNQDAQPTINVTNKIPVTAYTQNKILSIIINQWVQFWNCQLIPQTTLWVRWQESKSQVLWLWHCIVDLTLMQ
jgi:hypothetical protein